MARVGIIRARALRAADFVDPQPQISTRRSGRMVTEGVAYQIVPHSRATARALALSTDYVNVTARTYLPCPMLSPTARIACTAFGALDPTCRSGA